MKSHLIAGVSLLVFSIVATLGLVTDQKWSSGVSEVNSQSQPPSEPQVMVPVEVAPLEEKEIHQTVTGFGTVVPMPGKSEIYTVPYESRVAKVLVFSGMEVDADQPLIEIESSPDSTFKLSQAREELQSASNLLEVIREKVSMKLATQQEFLQQKQAVETANLQFQTLIDQGIGSPKTVISVSDGIVGSVNVQAGEIIPAGAVLLTTVAEGDLTIHLGVEEEDSVQVEPGCQVLLSPVLGPKGPFEGSVRSVSRNVDADTRLVDIYVQTSSEAHLLLNQHVRGQILTSKHRGLLAPPLAIIPSENGDNLFTVKEDRAIEHHVTLGLNLGDSVEVEGSNLQVGQSVVVAGASQLSDGMQVKVKSSE
ncbi:MAG: efflux RND transporter periplasmic adaptor subunit [Candidatus Omnitrophica bacterium]|nr:efflux RND transporter periplasmic adaptor subunit [Candidatus Omnitrophota bacterium]MCA9415152.1 efflux RND transporter periplasmic adaptor subunit [Candidatus Omnitrophota bacterium]MCA9434978.1 efflux RND transporter periplasmic adaptor subunit [Candidatus Omnitrophota bacterium]MCB9783763.1 efflux RND transporter periplasmic adaptor subunit [Candidatus Omnitrophota bacterium]